MRTLLFSLVFLFSGFLLHSQNYSRYTLESLVDILGRSQYSPKLDLLNSDSPFKKSKVKNADDIMETLWFNEALTLFFFDDDDFLDNLLIVESIGFQLEEVRSNKIPLLEKGFLGIMPYMKRSKVDKILKTIDPAYINEGTNKAWAKYKEDYKIKVQFNGAKNSSQVLRVYVYLNTDKYEKRLKQDFMDFGPDVLLPQTIITRYNKNKENPNYFNIIPEKGCESCFLTNKNYGTITFLDGATFTGKFEGLLGQEGIYSSSGEGEKFTYNGSFLSGEASGQGVISFTSNEIIKGTWEYGKIKSVKEMDRGDYYYTGEVNSDFQMNGQGKISQNLFSCEGKFLNDKKVPDTDYTIRQNGNVYIGHINESFKPSGIGSFTMSNGDTYKGTFANGDLLSGKVKASLAEGVRYEGNYKGQQMHGVGKLTYPNGKIIEGDFVNGQFTRGTGTLIFNEGLIYKGSVNGKMDPEGQGKYKYANGDYINCITTNGVYTNVEGKKTMNDGSIYIGQLNSKMLLDGIGKVEANNGVYIEGKFSNDTFLGGKGFLKFDNGHTYKGEINGNKQPYGKGVYTSIPGKDYINATFNNNSVVPGYGIRQYVDGARYEGQMDSQGNPDGKGKIFPRSGVTISGKFKGNIAIGSVTVEDNGKVWEGPVDKQFKPNGKGRFKTSSYSSWQYGSFSHGNKQ